MKFEADFHSKMGVCRHELGGGGSTPNPSTIPTLYETHQSEMTCYELAG